MKGNGGFFTRLVELIENINLLLAKNSFSLKLSFFINAITERNLFFDVVVFVK